MRIIFLFEDNSLIHDHTQKMKNPSQ